MAELSQTYINEVLNTPDFTLKSKATYEGRVLKLYCKQYENGASANSSTIRWVARSEGGVVNWYNTGPTTIKIGSQTVINKLARPGLNWNFPTGRNSLKSGEFTVSHKADGSIDALAVSISTAIYWGEWNLQTTDAITWKLRKIARYFSGPVKCEVSNVHETGCTVTVTTTEEMSDVTIKAEGKTYSATKTMDSSKKKATFTVSNLQPGTQYKLIVTATRKDSGLTSQASVTPTTYHYPYVMAVDNATVYPGDTVNLTIYNPLKRIIRVYMGLTNNSVENVIQASDSTGTLIGWTFNLSEADIYENLPASTTATVYYYCVITDNNKWSQKTKTGKISIRGTEIPEIPSNMCYWKDGDTSTTSVTKQSTYSASAWMVQNRSRLTTKINQTATGHYTSIKSYTFKIGNIEKEVLAANAGVAVDWGVLNLTGEQTLKITVTDMRGLTASVTKKIMFYPYKKPSLTFTAKRRNNYGTNIDLEYGYEFTNVNGTNTVKIQYLYYYPAESSGSGSYTTLRSGVSIEKGSGTYVLQNIYNEKTVVVSMYIFDSFTEGYSPEDIVIQRGQPIFFIDEVQNGVGVNCFPSGEGVWLSGKAYIAMSADGSSIKFGFKE